MSKGDAQLWAILRDKFEMLRRLGKPREAIRAAETLAALGRRAFGRRHPKVAAVLYDLATLQLSQKLTEAAEPHLHEAAEMLEETGAEDRVLLVQIYSQLALLATQAGRGAEAGTYYERAIPIVRELEGGDSLTLASLFNNAALVQESINDLPAASGSYKASLAIYERLGATNSADYATILHNYGNLLAREERYADARDILTQSSELRTNVLSPDDPTLAQTHAVLAVAHHGMGDLVQAQHFYEQSLQVFQKNLPAYAEDYRQVMTNLGSLLRSQGKTRQADSLQDHLRRLARRPLHEY
ncbi:MAG: tetratricopeptide repeat protein [Chthoniobacteraceae bacterium]